MEKKTIEEIQTAVLAECERVCPDVSKYFDIEIGGQPYKVIRPDNEIRYVFWTTGDSSFRVADIAKWHGDNWWPLHYAMLGLEARDDVGSVKKFYADLKMETDKCDRELAAIYAESEVGRLREIGRAAKLVEALKRVKNTDSLTMAKTFALEALIAHKKGGASNG